LITTSLKVESVTSDTAPIENSCSLLAVRGREDQEMLAGLIMLVGADKIIS
jgi:hypothetical protein